MKKYDLIVVGGGLSGVAAAIAAAREGVSVLLLEASNCLGGAASNNLVYPFMGSFTEKDGKLRDLSRGIFEELRQELAQHNAIHAYEFKEEYLKLVLNRMAIGAGVELLFQAMVIDVQAENGTVFAVTVHSKSGPVTFEADYFVDATGDANLSVMAGAATTLGRESDGLCQPMTLCFRVCNVDKEQFFKDQLHINPLYSEWQKAGKIKNVRENVLVFDMDIDGMLHFNSTRIVKRNPVDIFDVTKAEIEAREQVFELFDFLKANFSSFAHSEMIMTALQIGVRESRMIVGEYRMTGQDVVDCRKFEDGIAAGNYDIDIHSPDGSGTSHYWIPAGEFYTIPYRCLIPKGFCNLLVAGRCISADHEAQASVRIMPICCCMGEAAGLAVSLANKTKAPVSAVDITVLREKSVARGGFLACE